MAATTMLLLACCCFATVCRDHKIYGLVLSLLLFLSLSLSLSPLSLPYGLYCHTVLSAYSTVVPGISESPLWGLLREETPFSLPPQNVGHVGKVRQRRRVRHKSQSLTS